MDMEDTAFLLFFGGGGIATQNFFHVLDWVAKLILGLFQKIEKKGFSINLRVIIAFSVNIRAPASLINNSKFSISRSCGFVQGPQGLAQFEVWELGVWCQS